MNEPIPVSLAIRAVERAIRDCDATEKQNVYLSKTQSASVVYWLVLARAGFRSALRYLHADIEHALLTGESLCDAESAAVAPLIDHYDRVAPGWRTE